MDLAPLKCRSAVTNETVLHLGKVDQRTPTARRFKDLYAGLVIEAAARGRASDVDKQFCRRAATLIVACEKLEARLVSEEFEPADVMDYVRAAGALSRALRALGLEPVATAGTDDNDAPSLADYLANRGVTG